MILETLDGKAMKKFIWEDEEDYEPESTLKVEITSPHISWYPKAEKPKPFPRLTKSTLKKKSPKKVKTVKRKKK